MFAVSALEIAHFSRGTSLMLEVGYFAIPATFALTVFRTLKERAVGATIVFYLAHRANGRFRPKADVH